MLPPPSMLTTKKRVRNVAIISLTLLIPLAGCTPPGPRALLEGKQLLERAEYAQALEKFRTATSLLKTNRLAWSARGLACQYAGQPAEAEAAYNKALNFDRDLMEARYNLGCLLLDENRPDAAKTHFTAYVLRRGNSSEALLKLGTAHLR